jgi:TPR repeat protein
MIALGFLYFDKGDLGSARNWFQKAADAGDQSVRIALKMSTKKPLDFLPVGLYLPSDDRLDGWLQFDPSSEEDRSTQRVAEILRAGAARLVSPTTSRVTPRPWLDR